MDRQGGTALRTGSSAGLEGQVLLCAVFPDHNPQFMPQGAIIQVSKTTEVFYMFRFTVCTTSRSFQMGSRQSYDKILFQEQDGYKGQILSCNKEQ